MSVTIEPVVHKVEVADGDPGEKVITLVLIYTGTENVAAQITEDDTLSIELPSHAPPSA